jgi:hypothetical protein
VSLDKEVCCIDVVDSIRFLQLNIFLLLCSFGDLIEMEADRVSRFRENSIHDIFFSVHATYFLQEITSLLRVYLLNFTALAIFRIHLGFIINI